MENQTLQFLNRTGIEIEKPDLIWLGTLILLGIVCIFGTIGNLLVLGVFIQHYFWPHLYLKHKQLYKLKQKSMLNNNHHNVTNTTTTTTNSTINSGENNSIYFDDLEKNYVTESNEQLFTHSTGTPTFFILVLACADLIVCCLVVPLTIYMEYIFMRPKTDFWCKSHTFLSICNIMFSSLLIIAIALDRYLAICHPLRHILTMKRAKYLTFFLAIFCILYGILGMFHNELNISKSEPFIKQCHDTPDLFNRTNVQLIFYDILQKGNTASFILSILSVIILYSLILHVVLKTHRSNKFKPLTIFVHNTTTTHNNNNNNNNNNNHPHTAYNEKNRLSNENNEILYQSNNNITDLNKLSIHRLRFSLRGITESTIWRELRSASVLFVVAIVYIIVFTPALLTANKLINFNLLAYNTYYLNNMSNPLIYCFMSKSFRKKLHILLCNMCWEKQLAHHEQIFAPPKQRARPRLH